MPTFVPVLALVVTVASVVLMELGLTRQGFVRSRPIPDHRPDHTFADDAVRFSGGTRLGWRYTPLGAAVLRADALHVCIRTGPREVWIDRASVRDVHGLRVALIGGVRFATAGGGHDGLLFLTTNRSAVLSALSDLGWPVRL